MSMGVGGGRRREDMGLGRFKGWRSGLVKVRVDSRAV